MASGYTKKEKKLTEKNGIDRADIRDKLTQNEKEKPEEKANRKASKTQKKETQG